MKLTPFESEILDSILWQVEGFRQHRVKKAATTRILRATIRRIRPRLVAQSQSAGTNDCELDHAIPVHVLCDRILSTEGLDRSKLEELIATWLVVVKLTAQEHREMLRKCGVSRCMPPDWDGVDPLARYKLAGIQLGPISHSDGDESQ